MWEPASLLSLFTKLCWTTIYFSCSSRLKLFSGKAPEAALQSSWVEQSKAGERENQNVPSLFPPGWSQVLKLWTVVLKLRRENSSDPLNSQVPLWRSPRPDRKTSRPVLRPTQMLASELPLGVPARLLPLFPLPCSPPYPSSPPPQRTTGQLPWE